MNKSAIHLRTTAPLFMAGANTNAPELRAASIKGAMRFIWRAIQCADSVDVLRAKEGELFGNAFGGDSTKQSLLRIRVEKASFSMPEKLNMVPHRSLAEYDGRGRPFSAPAIKPGESFDVVLTSFCDPETHLSFVRLFVVTCLLYGFGRRSRKGFGTVEITGIDGIGEETGFQYDDLFHHLKEIVIQPFGTTYSQSGDRIVSHPTVKPAKYPYIESIRIAGSKTPKNTDSIIKQIGMETHDHAKENFLGSASPRFASSVLLSTVPWGNKGYCCIVTQLSCTKGFLPDKRSEFYQKLDGRV